MFVARSMPSIIAILLLIDVGLGLAYVGHYYFVGDVSLKLTNLLDLNGERSLCMWYSSTKLFCISLLGLLYASGKSEPKNNSTYLLFGLPAIFLFLSMDETLQFHEWLAHRADLLLSEGTREGTIFSRTGIWMFVLGIPFALFFAWLMYSVRGYLTESVASLRKIAAGMAMFLLGALGIETGSNFVNHDTFEFILQVLMEEQLEMLGATVMLWGMYGLAATSSPVGFLVQPPARPASKVGFEKLTVPRESPQR